MLSGLVGTCYIDDRARILPKQLGDLSDNTPSKCKSECNKLGYPLAGVQFRKQCFCGNEIASRAKIAPSNNCNMRCPGDGTVFCGGSWRMNIYSVKESEGEIDSLNLKRRTLFSQLEDQTCRPQNKSC